MLTPRQRKILYLIVQLYGEFEEPVGSKTLLKESLLNVSPATIRNDMVILEREGLLKKAHTSSGRIPSFDGYRYYVNRLIHHEEDMKVSGEDRDAFSELFRERQYDELELAQMCADILVSMTGYTSVVFGQSKETHRLKELKLVFLNDNSLIAILLTDKGKVESQLFQTNFTLTKDLLKRTAQIINDELMDLPLDEVSQRMKLTIPLLTQRIVSYQFDFSELIEKTMHHLKGHHYNIIGKNNLFDFVDAQSTAEELKQLFTLIDGSPRMYQLLEERQPGIEVLFGIDVTPNGFTNLSIVTGTFTIQHQQITIGLVGPTTMSYHRVIALMEKMIHELANT